MTFTLSRRQFVASTALLMLPRAAHAITPVERLDLFADRRTIEVKGRAATILSLRNKAGAPGLVLDAADRFVVRLHNRTGEQTIVHWHGQTPPPDQDGVADTGYVGLVEDAAAADYNFVSRAGTHWMHSHNGLQEMRLMAAPLIVRTAEDKARDAREVTVLLQDFSFREPAELLASVTGMAGMDHSAMGHGDMAGMSHGPLDLNDVEFDAYLANERTLDDPEVVAVSPGDKVLLRLINGAAATAFWIDLGGLTGTVIAADGNPVQPVEASRLPMAQAQRLDVLVTVPAGGGAFPILALREGDARRTGIILATPGAAVVRIADTAEHAAPPVDLSLEARLAAAAGLPARPADVTRRLRLTGSMMPYAWTIDGRRWADRVPVAVKPGQRVVIDLVNESEMAHPMHLHGHHFQVVSLNGKAIAGAVRDSVLVPVGGSVGIAFDADNAGRWLLHCHNLLHMATGMMTEVVYA